MKRVIVLRPEPGASATVERAKGAGLNAVAIPLFCIEPVAWKAPDAGEYDGLLLTSANAVRHAGEQLQAFRQLRVFAVGEASAAAARETGFDIAATGDQGVERLLGSIDPSIKLLHLCGEDRTEPSAARQSITAIPVYQAREVPDPEMRDLDDAVVLIHSPRAARRLAELARERARTVIAAISDVAAAAAGDGWARVEAASEPTDDALLALASRLCNNSHQQ